MATFSDKPRLLELLLEMQASSKYASYDPPIEVHEEAASSLLMQAINRNGHTNNGGALVLVADGAEKVDGFMIGVLDRVYHIGNRLRAQDMFLYCNTDAPARAATELVDGYIKWAFGNQKVAEIMLSWTDVGGIDGAKLEALYERKGFRRCGGIFERLGR